MKRKSYLDKMSYKTRFILCSLLVAMIPCTFLLLYYLNNMQSFYRERTEIFQENELKMAQMRLEDIVRQTKEISEEVLGSVITDRTFENYKKKTPYEKLLIMRAFRNQLSNKAVTSRYIDNIYVLTFDRDVFSSNTEMNEEAYLAGIKESFLAAQKGTEELQATHRAQYRKLYGENAKVPYVISYCKYLNEYTPGSIVGMIQIDILYQVMEEAVSAGTMTDTDFLLIVDGDNRIVYAPNEDWLEKGIEEITDENHDYPDILEKLKSQTVYEKGEYNYRLAKIDDFDWRILQVNSGEMLKRTTRDISATWLLVSALCIMGAVSLSLVLSISINRSIVSIIGYMVQASKGNFEIKQENLGKNEFGQLADAFNDMIEHIDKLMMENVKKEHERTTMELMALNSKINSHFLYNTLNLVKLLAVKNKQMDIAYIIVALCGILEYSYKSRNSLVPVRQEVEFVKNYIYIQTVRFNKEVTVDYRIPEELYECMIPMMIMQPIVENSFIHAFDKNTMDNKITITIEKNQGEDRLSIEIEDNGKGFSYEGLEKLSGIGLSNVIQRMQIFFGNDFLYDILSNEWGTSVIFKLPLIENKNEEENWKL